MCMSVSITVQGFVSIISFCHLLLFAVSVYSIFSCIDYYVHVAEELSIVQGHVPQFPAKIILLYVRLSPWWELKL